MKSLCTYDYTWNMFIKLQVWNMHIYNLHANTNDTFVNATGNITMTVVVRIWMKSVVRM